MSGHWGNAREVLFEFRHVGQQVRVAAIDPQTGLEVIVIAPATATQEQMKAVAGAKLARRLMRLHEQERAKRPGREV